LGECGNNRLKVSAIIGMEQVWDVLEDDELREKRPDDFHAVEENARLAATKTALRLVFDKIRHDREILAGAAKGDGANSGQSMCAPIPYVFKLAGPRKSIGKAIPVDVIELDLPARSPTSLLEANVPATDAGADSAKRFVLIHALLLSPCTRTSFRFPFFASASFTRSRSEAARRW
jgi:hypothetical protein